MRQVIRTSLHFYGRFAAISNLVSLTAAFLLFQNGTVLLPVMLLFKLAMTALFTLVAVRQAGAAMYFYYNQQVSLSKLAFVAVALDLCIFALLIPCVL